jgi:hypothetical protein
MVRRKSGYISETFRRKEDTRAWALNAERTSPSPYRANHQCAPPTLASRLTAYILTVK